MNIEVWSDVVCPWCYLGKRRLERALESAAPHGPVSNVYRAFQLDPAAAKEPIPRDAMLKAKYRISDQQLAEMDRRLEQTAAAEGIEYHLSGGRVGNTHDAHLVLQAALDRGIQDQVLDRLYRAYFTEQRSIFDRPSLTALAAEAGLGADDVERAFADSRYDARVRRDIEEARALGVGGVPFFVFERRLAVSGAQPVETFVAALTRAADAPTPAAE